VLESELVCLRMPLAGKKNHFGSMYAGALFTLVEIPGGALFKTRFDVTRFQPLVEDMQLRFRRPATGDICVEAHTLSKAQHLLALELTDATGELLAKRWRLTASCTRGAKSDG
jgi:acyl-coenzyme A thioesterase PaaI-like protein